MRDAVGEAQCKCPAGALARFKKHPEGVLDGEGIQLALEYEESCMVYAVSPEYGVDIGPEELARVAGCRACVDPVESPSSIGKERRERGDPGRWRDPIGQATQGG